MFQKSLAEQADESVLEQTVAEESKPEEPTIPGFEIVIDDDDDEPHSPTPSDAPEVVSLESDESKPLADDQEESQDLLPEEDGDDDDVILNEVAPIKIVVDDDDEEYNPEEPIENMVKIKKEKVDKLDDGFVEVSGLVSLQNGGQIKIKAEPVDPGKSFTIFICTVHLLKVSLSLLLSLSEMSLLHLKYFLSTSISHLVILQV